MRAGDITSRAEKVEIRAYFKRATLGQKYHLVAICGRTMIRNSFKHGSIRKLLTIMALYACRCELMHDFHLFTHGSALAQFFSLVATKHAVGLIAVSHVSEHVKEMLEEAEKPEFSKKEHLRHEVACIFGEKENLSWPPYLKKHHRRWKDVRGELGALRLEVNDSNTVADPAQNQKEVEGQ